MNNEIPANAVVVREEVLDTTELRNTTGLPAALEKPLTTPAQAKIDAVASVTMSAYQKASQLTLIAEEVARLKADFPDEAFKPGAGGKEQLIYCEHAFLRDRLDEVLGMGQWALVPRNRWAEPFKTTQGKDGSRVYFEGMLMVRGCFVSEAIGEMEYYPHNASQNYGDAVEGAESACLRRCCKKWGIGLQAWKKDWCEGWWQRKRAGKQQPTKPVESRGDWPEPPAPQPPGAPKKKTNPLPEVLKASKLQFCENVRKEGKLFDAWVYLVETGTILDTEQIEDARVQVLFPSVKEEMDTESAKPLLKKDYDQMMGDICAHTILEAQYGDWHEKFTHAYNENRKKRPVEVPREPNAKRSEPFWSIICPIPRKGQKLADYQKHPDTIQSLYDAAKDGIEDAGKRLFGFANNWKPEARQYNGKTYPPTDADYKFRDALNHFLAWHDEQKHQDDFEDEMSGVETDRTQ